MPFVGLGVFHILIALFFAVHAVRTGQPIYWLFILLVFPLLGSIVYFLAIYLPNSGLQYGARKAIADAARAIDPTRELREARAAFEFTPTAQNQMRLAQALLETGNAEEAAVNYEACLQGQFASQPEIKILAARAFVESGRYARALEHLEEIRAKNPSFKIEQVGLLLARSLAGVGRNDEAKEEFETLVNRFGSFDALAEYTIWALANGDTAVVERLKPQIDETMKRWNRHARELNAPLMRRMAAARDATKK